MKTWRLILSEELNISNCEYTWKFLIKVFFFFKDSIFCWLGPVQEAERKPIITQAQEGRKTMVLKLRIGNMVGIVLENGGGIYTIFYIPNQSPFCIFLPTKSRVEVGMPYQPK